MLHLQQLAAADAHGKKGKGKTGEGDDNNDDKALVTTAAAEAASDMAPSDTKLKSARPRAAGAGQEHAEDNVQPSKNRAQDQKCFIEIERLCPKFQGCGLSTVHVCLVEGRSDDSH